MEYGALAEKNALREAVSKVSLAFILYLLSSYAVAYRLPEIIELVIIFVGYFIGGAVGSTGITTAIDSFLETELFAELASVMVYVISIAIAIVSVMLFTSSKSFFGLSKNASFGECVGKNRAFVYKNILPLVFLSMTVAMTMSIIAIMTGWSSGNADRAFPTEAGAIIVYFVGIAVLPPLLEELLFRGLLLSIFLPFGRTVAVLVSAVLFAMMHGSGHGIAYAFAVGIMLAIVAVESCSLLPCILIHAINNCISFLQTALCEFFPEYELLISGAISITLLFLGLISFYLVFGREKRLCTDVHFCSYLEEHQKLKAVFTPSFIALVTVTVLFAFLYEVV